MENKGLMALLGIILAVVLSTQLNDIVFAETAKKDGLLLKKAMEDKGIKADQLLMSYGGLVKSFRSANEVQEFEREAEQAFDTELEQVSAKDNKKILKYEGVIHRSSEVKFVLIGVLEGGKYNTYLIVSLTSDQVDEVGYNEAYSYLSDAVQALSLQPKIKVNFRGSINEQLTHKQQEAWINDMFSQLEANVKEGLNENEVVSLTGYSELMKNEVRSGENPVNVQIASRYDDGSKRTVFTVGTPLITTEY
jgi:hypothetical protein